MDKDDPKFWNAVSVTAGLAVLISSGLIAIGVKANSDKLQSPGLGALILSVVSVLICQGEAYHAKNRILNEIYKQKKSEAKLNILRALCQFCGAVNSAANVFCGQCGNLL